MSPWLVAIIAGVIVALIQYGVRDLRSGPSIVSALLRVAAVALVVALVLDAPASRAKPVAAWGALDGSLSMARGDTMLWRAARDTIARMHPESVLVFGDSARRADSLGKPRDLST